MKLLLDTHVFLWAIGEPAKLSKPARRALQSLDNELALSCVSLLEITIKVQTGKLKFPVSRDFIEDCTREIGIARILDVTPAHAYAMLNVPRIHGGPFDRLLAAQCIVERMRLVSANRVFKKYPIEVIW